MAQRVLKIGAALESFVMLLQIGFIIINLRVSYRKSGFFLGTSREALFEEDHCLFPLSFLQSLSSRL